VNKETIMMNTAPSPAPAVGLLRPLLWVLLVLSAAGTALISSAHLSPFVEIPVGVVGAASIAALVVHHYRNRRR
jgi:hypothetical protein